MSVSKYYKASVVKVIDDRTVKVSVSRRSSFPICEKKFKVNKTFLCEFNSLDLGFNSKSLNINDEVLIVGVPKVSKKKFFSIRKKYWLLFDFLW